MERQVKRLTERLDKFLSAQTGVSRKEARIKIWTGQVTVNDVPVVKPDVKINSEKDQVKVDNRLIFYQKHLYIMLNKPPGVVCSTKDGQSPTVLSLLPPELCRKGLFPAGRLDKDTEGFVLITDDGALSHRMLSPRKHVSKKYLAVLKQPWLPEYAQAFASGMSLLTGERCLPAGCEPASQKDIQDWKLPLDARATHTVWVTLQEGMYHQIKRMFETLDNQVIYLKRVTLGGLYLDGNLPVGQHRILNSIEIAQIFE